MTEQVKLTNVEIAWPFLADTNTSGEYASGKYELTLILTPEQAALIKEQGIAERQKIKPAKDRDGMFQLTVKSQKEPYVYDSTGAAMSYEDKKKIGNGSIVNLYVTIFEVRGQRFAGLGKVVVTKLKEYTGGAGAGDLLDNPNPDAAELIDD